MSDNVLSIRPRNHSREIPPELKSVSPHSIADLESLNLNDEQTFLGSSNEDCGKLANEKSLNATQDEKKSSFWGRVMAWSSMVLAILAASSIGPAFKYMQVHGISACLAASWRCQTMVLFLVPLAIAEVMSDKKKQVDWFVVKSGLTYPVIVHVIISGVAWAANLLLWIVGLQYTTTFKASLVASSHPILLVVSMQCKGMPVSRLEWLGVVVSFGGMVLSTSKDIFAGDATAKDRHYEFIGLFLCLLAAAAEVVVLFNRIITKKHVPLMQYTAATTIVVCLLSSFAALALEGGNVMGNPTKHGIEVFCRQDHCIFGWTSEKWALRILMFGLWIGVICIAGFNYAMQYIPPLVFSSLGLVDPAITAVLSWLIGVEHLPSLVTWIGGSTVMAGVGIITYGENLREKANHAEPERHESGGDATAVVGSTRGRSGSNLQKMATVMQINKAVDTRYKKLDTQDETEGADYADGNGDIELGPPVLNRLHYGFATVPICEEEDEDEDDGDDVEDGVEDEGSVTLSKKEQRMLRRLQSNILNLNKKPSGFDGTSSGDVTGDVSERDDAN